MPLRHAHEKILVAHRAPPRQIDARQDALGRELLEAGRDGAVLRTHDELVEGSRLVRELPGARRDELLLQVLGLGEALLGDLDEAFSPEETCANRDREGAESVVRADVARGSLAPDVLLTRRERQHVAALPVLVDGLAAEPTGDLGQELACVLAGEEAASGAAVLR